MLAPGVRPSSERHPNRVGARVYIAYTCRVGMLATGEPRLACLFLGARVVLDFGTFFHSSMYGSISSFRGLICTL